MAAKPVVVNHVTRKCEIIPASQATATDWLRMLVREKAITPAAKEASQLALDSITLKSGESWIASSTLLVRYKRTTLADSDRPHNTEQTFFWRYISESHLKGVMKRLARLLVPSDMERYGVIALANVYMTECSELLRSRPVSKQDTMGTAIQERGARTKELYNRYARVLSARPLPVPVPTLL